jgi:hypothetical protein
VTYRPPQKPPDAEFAQAMVIGVILLLVLAFMGGYLIGILR